MAVFDILALAVLFGGGAYLFLKLTQWMSEEADRIDEDEDDGDK